MLFINEFITAEDVEKYGIKSIDQNFIVGGTNSRQWTIDREREIYLRNVARGGGNEPEIRNQTKWSFFWHSVLLTLRLDLVDGGGRRGEPGWSHWRLVRINGGTELPANLHTDKNIFIEDLKNALLAYKDFGAYSTNTDYRIVFDIDRDCVL